MQKNEFFGWQILFLLCIGFLFTSCNRSGEGTMPQDFVSYPQPVTQPLRLTDPKPLRWDTLAHSVIMPVSFPLDLNNLNGQPYDPTGFKPLSVAPTQTPFNFAALPSRPFDLKKILEYPLKMETRVMPLPSAVIKFQKPERVIPSAMGIKEWQQISGLNVLIYTLIKDSIGIMWMGTSNGIYRFDGVELTNFISGKRINGLCFDKEGNLWCIDQTDPAQTSIVKFDFKNETLGKAYFNFSTGRGIISMSMDPSGFIWVTGAVAMPSPVILDPVKNSYHVLNSVAGFNSSHYSSHCFDNENRIWLASGNGIEIIDNRSNRVYQLNRNTGLSQDTVSGVITGANGIIWAAVPGGVERIGLKTGDITHFHLSNGNSQTNVMLMDKTGQVWLGSNNGIGILNPAKNLFRHAGLNEGLAWPSAINMIEDNHGQVLIAAYNGSFSTIYIVSQYGKTVYPFGNTNIISAIEDSRGNMWIGTGKGLFVVDSSRRSYRLLGTSDGLADPFVQSVTEEGNKLIITTDNGYNIFDPQKNQLLRIGKPEGLLSDTVLSVMTDAQGNTWVTGTYRGITKYDAAHQVVLGLNKAGGLNGNNIVQTILLKNNKVMILPLETGPSIIDLTRNTIQAIKGYQGINSYTYKRMIEDEKGGVWISGQSNGWGLYMIDPGLKNITHFTTREGLNSDAVSSVLNYQGRILAGTNLKVNIITPPDLSASHQWQVDVMAHSEDLIKSSGSFMSDGVTKSGNYLWGDAGLKIIHGIVPDTTRSVNLITGVAIMGKARLFADSKNAQLTNAFGKKNEVSMSESGYLTRGKIKWNKLSGPFQLPVKLSLPHDQNIIRFRFTELSSGRPDSVEFAYLLEGIDKAWTYTNDPQTDSYLNLSPGHYTFKVSSRWRNGRWNLPDTFSFVIRSPWYSTWWSYIIYAILLAAAILGIIRVQRNMVIARERQKSKVREAQLRAEAENDRRKNVELISEMGRDINSSLSLENIIETVYRHVNELMDASVFGIGVYDKEKNHLEFPATKENGKTLFPYYDRLDDESRPASWCFKNRKEIITNDFEKDRKNYVSEISDPVAGDHVKSLIYLPLIHKDNCLGVLTAQSFSKNAYNDYHVNVLRSLATYTTVALDNSEAYRRLQSAQVQLIQSEKMASLGELTAGIAHEIQNPLNFVNNFSEINRELIMDMREEIEKGDIQEIRSLADSIDSNEEKVIHHGKRADAIVKAMLQHTRGSSGEKEPADINALAEEYLRLSFHGMRAKDKSFNPECKTDFDKSLNADERGNGKINVVPQDIGRVLLNLLNNAFYAVNERQKKDGNGFNASVLVKTRREKNHVEISVADNGEGIPPDIRRKIFQPFFTTKPTGKGTGLGLSLSYDIVKAHGGNLTVESKENEGTEFTIQLPIG